jgi:nicotinate-nucleotide pyrophosphorylase (carboxylating)
MTIDDIILNALSEDIGDGDHTTLATLSANIKGKASLLIKDNGVLCGVNLAERIFKTVDPSLQINIFFHDGDVVKKGDVVFNVIGNKASILKSERLVLNFMQRLSGIATQTTWVLKLLAV